MNRLKVMFLLTVFISTVLLYGCGISDGLVPEQPASTHASESSITAENSQPEEEYEPEPANVESNMQTVTFEAWNVIPIVGSGMFPVWGDPTDMHLKDGYLVYVSFDFDADNNITYSLNRAEISSGAMLSAIVTHTQAAESFYAPPAFTGDAIVVLTDTAIQRYNYELELIQETALSQDALDMLSREYMRLAFTNSGDEWLITDQNGMPSAYDYTTGGLRSMTATVLPNGVEPAFYTSFETTADDDVFVTTAHIDETSPYYRVMYNLREDRIINYFEVDISSNGEIEPDEAADADLYKWFDASANIGYDVRGATGLWRPVGVSRTGLVFKEQYGAGTLEVADFAAKTIYTLELDDKTFCSGVVADDDTAALRFFKHGEEQIYILVFPRARNGGS